MGLYRVILNTKVDKDYHSETPTVKSDHFWRNHFKLLTVEEVIEECAHSPSSVALQSAATRPRFLFFCFFVLKHL